MKSKIHKTNKNKMRMNKCERNLRYKNHLKYLYETVGGYYPAPVTYTGEVWVNGYGYVKNIKPYYKRLYRSKTSKWLKRQSNKKIRRCKGELYKGNDCHKLYDFWHKYC